MSIAKTVVTGTVYRAAEERFTHNNVSVSAFVMNIGERDELLIRVISKRQNMNELVSSLTKGEKILVEGRLQTNSVKTDSGAERKIFEIDANSIERMGANATTGESANY